MRNITFAKWSVCFYKFIWKTSFKTNILIPHTFLLVSKWFLVLENNAWRFTKLTTNFQPKTSSMSFNRSQGRMRK